MSQKDDTNEGDAIRLHALNLMVRTDAPHGNPQPESVGLTAARPQPDPTTRELIEKTATFLSDLGHQLAANGHVTLSVSCHMKAGDLRRHLTSS